MKHFELQKKQWSAFEIKNLVFSEILKSISYKVSDF